MNHSGKRRTIIQKLTTTIHQVPLTFLPSSFRSPPVGPQVLLIVERKGGKARACGMWGDVSNCRVAFAHGVSIEDLPGLHGWRMTLEELLEALRGTPKALTFHYLTLKRRGFAMKRNYVL